MFPQFDFLAHLSHANMRMKQKAAPSRQTPTQHKRSETKLEQTRKKRDRRKLAKKLNRGNQWN
jgi:hypothetical protein